MTPEGLAMLSAYCPRHDAILLYSASSIVGLSNMERGIQILLRCFCGELIEVLTGRSTIDDEPPVPVA